MYVFMHESQRKLPVLVSSDLGCSLRLVLSIDLGLWSLCLTLVSFSCIFLICLFKLHSCLYVLSHMPHRCLFVRFALITPVYVIFMLLCTLLPCFCRLGFPVSAVGTAGLNLSLTFLIMDVLDVSRQVVFAIMYSVVRITMMFVFVNFLNMSI